MKKEIIVKAVIEIIMLGVIAAFFVAYLSTEPPYLTTEEVCPEIIPLSDWVYFNYMVKNYKEVDAYITPCVFSDQFLFENLKNNFCGNEVRLLQYTDVVPWKSYVNFKARIDLNRLDQFSNVSINIFTLCKQKIWGISKSCSTVSDTCRYTKTKDYWELQK